MNILNYRKPAVLSVLSHLVETVGLILDQLMEWNNHNDNKNIEAKLIKLSLIWKVTHSEYNTRFHYIWLFDRSDYLRTLCYGDPVDRFEGASSVDEAAEICEVFPSCASFLALLPSIETTLAR